MDDKCTNAIIWLTANMKLNYEYILTDNQIVIIKDIFVLSGIALPIEPTRGYNYYFKISDDWKTIKKVTYGI